MEIVISCIFFTMLIAFLAIYLKNATIIIKHEYQAPQITEIDDLYKSNGEPKEENDQPTIDDLLKAVNDVMLDQEG